MNEFLDALSSFFQVIFDDPLLGTLVRFSIALLPIPLMFRMIDSIFGAGVGCHFGLSDLICIFFEWLADKVITWLCRTEKGFKLAYNLGWARPGIDFFVCGQDCDKCPDCGKCNNDARVVGDVVIQNQDPDVGS